VSARLGARRLAASSREINRTFDCGETLHRGGWRLCLFDLPDRDNARCGQGSTARRTCHRAKEQNKNTYCPFVIIPFSISHFAFFFV